MQERRRPSATTTRTSGTLRRDRRPMKPVWNRLFMLALMSNKHMLVLKRDFQDMKYASGKLHLLDWIQTRHKILPRRKYSPSPGNQNRMRKFVKSSGTKLDSQKDLVGGKFKNWRCSPLEQWISYRNRMLKKILAGVQTETSSYTSWT